MKHSTLLTSALLGGLLFSTSALADGIRASLEMSKQNYNANEDVTVRVTLTNDEKVPVKILKWYTAADGVEEALFKVSVNGEAKHYLGAHYKRPAPQTKDYIKLKAGESVSYEVELSSLYDLTEQGNYEIAYDVSSMQLFAPNAGQQNKLARLGIDGIQSESVSFFHEGIETKAGSNKGKPGTGDGGGGGSTDGVSFSGRCSNSQMSDTLAGLAAAKSMAGDAKGYLNSASNPASSLRYNTWFGAYSSSRWNTVSNHFNAIDSALNTQPLTFDCSCKKSYYAYVYPTQPYKIYLCNAFWSAPVTGTDSKGGTIVHEMSHFDVVAGTDDVVYGHSGAKNLAQTNPDQAIQNADSHEYFAENTPFQN